jgi:hypothetical protein
LHGTALTKSSLKLDLKMKEEAGQSNKHMAISQWGVMFFEILSI